MRAIGLAAFVLASAAIVPAQSQKMDPGLVRLLAWFDAVEQHTAGSADIPASQLGAWLRIDLDSMVNDVRRIAGFQRSIRESRVGAAATLELYNRRFSAGDIEKLFRGNDTLRRAAVLHADIAMLVTHDATRQRGNGESGVLTVEDGRRQGVIYESGHWQIGRALLDLMSPGAGADAGAQLWYRAVSAHLMRYGHLSEARVHLSRGRQLFPDSWQLQLDSGYLDEKLSSASIQAAVQDLRSSGANPAVDSRRAQLERAERFFRQVLTLRPAEPDARLRLGHTLGELDRHEEAASELRKSIESGIRGDQLYYAELFLGREEEVLGRKADARLHYENAAELYPRAQSPRLALAQLARQSGDRNGAWGAFKIVTGLPSFDLARWDPWWEYYEYHKDDERSLVEQMHGLSRIAQ
jgi:tetratricopeptide (TPR) repeat protein